MGSLIFINSQEHKTFLQRDVSVTWNIRDHFW